MPRKLRLEVEGGRFRVIARGDDAQDIFHSNDDRLKTVSLPAKKKEGRKVSFRSNFASFRRGENNAFCEHSTYNLVLKDSV